MIETIKPYKILFVDDDPYFLTAIYRVLHRFFDVTTVDDPREALRIFVSQGPFDVVVTDYKMPGMDGLDMLKKMRKIEETSKRIVLTGYAELDVAMRAVNDGQVSGFLTKPVPFADLRNLISSALQSDQMTKDQTGHPLHKEKSMYQQQEQKKIFSHPLLTARENEVLNLVDKGLSNAEIARTLNITVGTVKSHLNNMFFKTNVNSRSKLIALQRRV